MPDLLFVYGTLRSGFDNAYARRLHEAATLVGRAAVRGRTMELEGYAAWVPDPDCEVEGELWRLPSVSEELLRELDEYEGPLYRRVEVQTTGGDMAWIYRAA